MKIKVGYRKFELPEDVSIDIRPLETWAYQQVLPLISGAFESVDEENQAQRGLEQLSNPELAKIISEVLPTHCKDLKGIEIDENGAIRQATIEDLTTQGILLNVGFQILVQLITISSIDGGEENELKKP